MEKGFCDRFLYLFMIRVGCWSLPEGLSVPHLAAFLYPYTPYFFSCLEIEENKKILSV